MLLSVFNELLYLLISQERTVAQLNSQSESLVLCGEYAAKLLLNKMFYFYAGYCGLERCNICY